MTSRSRKKKKTPLWKEHSLSLAALGIFTILIFLYAQADPKSHRGSFFGNAVADWAGVVVAIVFTKWFFESGSQESRQPHARGIHKHIGFLRRHSLTIVLGVTWVGWLLLFARVQPDSKWGTVVSNLASEWSQQIGMVVLTKKLIERGSKESHGNRR